ncbi:DUF3846 domain-containing protein [Agromyces soli]|uniref:DUF3846 domain-containing protein n=1 Tax=Agromyces soli TaxID=659012 RepID=A0ABY4APN5_9MICO|nr:DUF3846 domain-containing protein [Agromyces soli]UOE25122.1 DUF3846 domain-containing protein [Agromyces soli]
MREFSGVDDYARSVDGYIEAVDVPDLGVTIYVNEIGLLRRLPFNSRASFLWWYYEPAARESLLVRDAVIVGWPDADGESTDVPEAVLRLLTEPIEHGIVVRLDSAPGRDVHPMSRLAQIVLPLTAGDPSLLMSSARFASYFDALTWAVVLEQRWPEAEEVEVVPLVDGRPRLDP